MNNFSQCNPTSARPPTLALRGVRVDREMRSIRWQFTARYPGRPPLLIVARSTLNGLVWDLQRLGSVAEFEQPVAGAEWPVELVEAVGERVREELARREFMRRAA